MTNTPIAVAILHDLVTDAPILYCSEIERIPAVGKPRTHLGRTFLPPLTAESLG
jgi:hypothetical protein